MLVTSLLMLATLQGGASAGTALRPVQTADGSQRWSVLADPCAADGRGGEDVLVCGRRAAETPRLPLPDERGPPDRPMPGNPDVSGAGALAMTSAACATQSEGCTVGIDLLGGGTALIRLIGKAIDPDSCCEEPAEAKDPIRLVSDIDASIGRAFKKKPDKSRRVPILLDDLPPPEAETPVSSAGAVPVP